MTAPKKHVALLFLGDPRTDRRSQQFRRLFSEAGWKVSFYCGVAATEERSSSSGMSEGCSKIVLRNTAGPKRFLEYDRKLRQALAESHCDVVLACDLYSLGAAVQMKRRGRAATVVYDAREVYAELPSIHDRPLVRGYWKREEHRGLRCTDVILVTGPQDLQAILSLHSFIPRSLLVRNLPWLESDEILPASRERYGIPADVKVFVYVGGLQKARGLEILLRAMAHNGHHLLIVGDGTLRESLTALAKETGVSERVHFAGALDSAEALRAAAACDAGVSLIEPVSRSYELALPSKLFEYMSLGLPVVSTPLEQVTELFRSEPWIHFADPANAAEVQTALEASLRTSAEARAREQALYREHYHFRADADSLLRVLGGSGETRTAERSGEFSHTAFHGVQPLK